MDATPRRLPKFVEWPIFPFEGELRVRELAPPLETDLPRSGEPGGDPCGQCQLGDDAYLWVDDRWRVRAADRAGVPVVLFLEPREHVDLDGLDDVLAAELGVMTVRLDRAIQSIGGIGRVHVMRWGDGAAHLHLWFFARPLGAWQMAGLFMPMWAQIAPRTPEDVWDRNLQAVAQELARHGGRTVERGDA